MMASFCSVNLNGMSGLLSEVLRCCSGEGGEISGQFFVLFVFVSPGFPNILAGVSRPRAVQTKLTTMRVSLCFRIDSENARV